MMRTELTKKNIKERVRSSGGIYNIITLKKFHRFKGKSNIVYIGKTEKNLRERILNLLKNKQSHFASKRIKKIRESGYKLFFTVKYSKNAKELEKKLLNNYYKKHLELPPANHSLKD